MNEQDILQEHADVLMRIEQLAPTGSIPVPEKQRMLFEEARQSALAERSATREEGGGKILRPDFRVPWLRMAAVLILLFGVGALWWSQQPHQVPTAHVVVTSPGAEMDSTRPQIAWTSRDRAGQRYDVWILPGTGDALTAPALFKKENVVSPVEFAELEPGKGFRGSSLEAGENYRVLVCLSGAGRVAGVPVLFRVSSKAR